MENPPKKKGEFTNADAHFMRVILAAFNTAVENRGKSGVHGEITLKITQQAGRVSGAKIVEESILKPGDVQ